MANWKYTDGRREQWRIRTIRGLWHLTRCLDPFFREAVQAQIDANLQHIGQETESARQKRLGEALHHEQTQTQTQVEKVQGYGNQNSP